MQKRNNRWAKAALSLLLAGALLIAGCGGQESEKKDQTTEQQQAQFKPLPTDSKKVVLEYKGGTVTEGELNRYINLIAFLNPQLGWMMANMKQNEKEIRPELAKELAARKFIAASVKDDPQFVKKADETMKQYEAELVKTPASPGQKPPKSLDEAIKGKGFTKEDLHTFFVGFHKLEKYYEDTLKGMQYDYVKVNHILIAVGDGTSGVKRTDAEARKRADEVKKKLEAGGDFAALAKQYSDDPGSKDKGGLYEGAADQFVPEFANACKTLPLGKISDPVKTQYGYHIMKVTERKKAPLSQAPEDVKNAKKQEIYQQVIDKEIGWKLIG
jgi:foldase protein PrsA